MNNLTILNVEISTLNGLYRLNDLHKASDLPEHKRPSKFMANGRTVSFIDVLAKARNRAEVHSDVAGGNMPGTYGCKELLVAYGAWLSPEVDVATIQAFIEKVEQKPLTPAEMFAAQAQVNLEHEKQLAQIPILQDEIKALKSAQSHSNHIFHLGEYTSIKAYTNIHGVKLRASEHKFVGRLCSKHCRLNKIEIKKFPCPTFGEVNGYPEDVIEEQLLLGGFDI